MESLGREMEKAKQEIGLDDEPVKHRRGKYHCVNTGLSLGGGCKVCTVPLVLRPLLTKIHRDLAS